MAKRRRTLLIVMAVALSQHAQANATSGEAERLHNEARALAGKGMLDEAAALERAAARASPALVEPHRALSFIYSELGQLDSAEAEARESVRLDPRDRVSRLNLASILQSKRDFRSAHNEYAEAARQNPRDPEPQIGMAQCLMSLRRYDEALVQLELAIDANPDNQALWMNRAFACLRVNELPEALGSIERARAIGPRSLGVLVLKGEIELARFNYVGARQIADELMKSYPRDWRSYQLAARCYYQNVDRPDGAAAVLGEAERVLPSSGALYRRLGVEFRKKGDELAKLSLEARLDNAPAWWRLSERALADALLTAPSDPSLRLEQARTLARQRKYHAAVAQIKVARDLAPSEELYRTAARELSWVQSDLAGAISYALCCRAVERRNPKRVER